MPQILTLLIYSNSILAACCIATENKTCILIQLEARSDTDTIFSSQVDVFLRLLEEDILLVDKSLLIKELVEDDGKIYVITCPRRWGKSGALDMLKSFFRIQDRNYKDTSNYRLFAKGEATEYKTKFKSAFLIAKQEHIIDTYLGRYPVIHINLASRGTNNFAEWFRNIETAIGRTFHEHLSACKIYEEVIDDTKIDNSSKADAYHRCDKFVKFSTLRNEDQPDMLIESLHFLSETLFKYHKKKVIILIEEYSDPWSRIFQISDFPPKDKEKCLNFYTNFMEATLKNNVYIEKAVLTGIFSPSEELRQQAFPDAVDCNLLTGKFMEYFGFNQYELEKMFDFFNTSKRTRQAVDGWYKGYKANHNNFIIYNPESITSFFESNVTDNYWTNTTSFGHIVENFLKIPSFRKKWHSLKLDKSVVVKLDKRYFTWSDYEYLIRAMSEPVDVADEFTNKALMLLHCIGYLTLAKNANSTGDRYCMKFPNAEIGSFVPYGWVNREGAIENFI